jgi:DNA polymerase I-like protein with 3'-5' exonuclease and polymerase domains
MNKVASDGRIHAFVNSQGAITRRMTHSFHLAQVPASHSPYGRECRELFEVAAGKKLIGADGAGLELRMLAHYMARFDKGSYVNTVVNGSSKDGTDVHTMNQKFIGLNSRDAAKTWIYAYLYGAGNGKLGSVIYDDFTTEKREKFHAKYAAGPAREKALARLGGRARKAIEQGLPALGALQEKVKELSKKGYLKTVDGGRLRVRSAHSALNTLLQGGGAVVMKKALVVLVEHLMADGFVPNELTGELVRNDEALGFCVNVHDEWQVEADEHLAEYVGRLSCDAIRLAGEAFELRCPLAGEFGIGLNWSETH